MMRLAVSALTVLVVLTCAADDEVAEKPIPPAEAKKHIGKKVTVEMVVRASKKSLKMKKVFLDSLENFQDPENLGVTITEQAETELAQKHATDDIATFYRDKTIRVTGVIIQRDERTYLDVDMADQLKLVEKTP
jgi:hypothetical protein